MRRGHDTAPPGAHSIGTFRCWGWIVTGGRGAYKRARGEGAVTVIKPQNAPFRITFDVLTGPRS